MVKDRRSSRKNKAHRTRRAQRGGTCSCQRGGDSAAYSFGSAVSPGAPYASEVIAKSACVAVPRPGELGNYSAPSMGGLPGFGGGGRRRKRNMSFSLKNVKRGITTAARATRKFLRRIGQRGGRYTMDTAAAYGSGPNVFLPATRIPCEGSIPNPLNPGPHTPSSQPPLRGGARQRTQQGGVGGVDSAAYYAPTAGYGNQPSTWVSSTGTPSLLQIPYEAKAMNPACLKTGGGKRKQQRKRSSRRHRK